MEMKMDTENPVNETVNEETASNEVNNETINDDAAQQTETDWKAQAKKWEARAKENFAFKSDAEKYREYLESQKTEDEKRAEELSRTRLELEELRTETLKKDVALEKNIPTKVIKYLTGTTREELEASADDILSAFAESAKPNAKPNPEQGKPNGNTDSDGLVSFLEQNLLNK